MIRENTTITHCRLTHYKEDNLSKAITSLYPHQDDCTTRRTLSIEYQNNDQTQNPSKIRAPINNKSTTESPP